jgi:uncharacterized protein YegL
LPDVLLISCTCHCILIFLRGGTLFQNIKIWLARELRIKEGKVESINLTWQSITAKGHVDADVGRDPSTNFNSLSIDSAKYSITKNPPYISISLAGNDDFLCEMLPDQFRPETSFSDTFDDFMNEQSSGVLICAIGIIRWHRQAIMEQADGHVDIPKFPTDVDSYNQFVQVVKRMSVDWGNSSPAKWLDPEVGPFEISKLFCKSLGSRVHSIHSFSMLDLGSMVHILDRCFLFEHEIPNETLRSSIWAHSFWYQALDSGTALSEDAYSRISLILNELLTKVSIASLQNTGVDLHNEKTRFLVLNELHAEVPEALISSAKVTNFDSLFDPYNEQTKVDAEAKVCHYFATTGCKHPFSCTKGSHDPSLVFPHLQSIVCHICVQHGKCSAKGCSKQHSPEVIERYKKELARQSSSRPARQPIAYSPPSPAQQRPASARLSTSSSSLVHVIRHGLSLGGSNALVSTGSDSAIVAKLQGLGFNPQAAKAGGTMSGDSAIVAKLQGLGFNPPAAKAGGTMSGDSAIVAKLQGLGFNPPAAKAGGTMREVVVKMKQRRTNVVVVLDLSGSMRGRNLNNAKVELNKLWHLLQKGDSLTIITFSSSVYSTMPRRMKWEPEAGSAKLKTAAHFDEADLQAVVAGLQADGLTALYDAVALAMQQTQQACEKDIREHPNSERHTYQLLVITDGEDTSSKVANAASVNQTLRHPGSWAGKCHFSSCFVAIGPQAASALAPCTSGCKHSVTVSDIDAGFQCLTEQIAQVRTTTVQMVKRSVVWGGGHVAAPVAPLLPTKPAMDSLLSNGFLSMLPDEKPS